MEREMDIQVALQCMRQTCSAPCRSILDHIVDGVVKMDTEGLIFWFNKAAEQITGYAKEEALGRTCSEIFNSNLCGGDKCPLRKTLETGKNTVDLESQILSKEGKMIPINVSTVVVRDDKGRTLGAVKTFRDLSHLKLFQKDFYERYSFQNIISQNSQMIRIFRTLRDIAASDSTVLLQGESGTGKELIALAIHDLSQRRNNPYITVNCGALHDTLLESKLFGYAKGAFTDARRDKPGRFALAEGGTLFLDEVGDLSLELQCKLLRVVENGEYQPLGDTRTCRADVRIISATRRDLFQMVRQGRFRADLYYRLNVVRIQIPSLRDRREDIPLLIHHFIGKFNSGMCKSIRSLSSEAMKVLLDYAYPGNIRELENIIEYAFILAKGRTILPEHLPPHIWEEPWQVEKDLEGFRWNRRERQERDAILATLQENHWKKGKAAHALGISRTTLWRRMKRYGLIVGRSGQNGP